jgi:glutamate-5-semialdehyde dehydrogenase
MDAEEKKLIEIGIAARKASKKIAFLPTATKNKALEAVSAALLANQKAILEANEKDYKESEAAGMSASMLDRLLLTPSRIEGMASDVKTVVSLPDPIGETLEEKTLPNHLQLIKKRVPLGVIGAIFESRPNVTVDISLLCLKSGNAVILRGGKECLRSNMALVDTIKKAIASAGVPEGAVQFIESTDRSLVDKMLKMREYIDLMIPRGGAGLIKNVVENAAMAVVSGGIGVCHTYVDKKADITKAAAIIFNAKVQRPTVCNALDTILVHKDVARPLLEQVGVQFAGAGVEMHCDRASMDILKNISGLKTVPAVKEDWGKEFLALIAAVKVMDSLDEALEHIDTYGSGHSEAIVTEDREASARFLNEVDAACVYSNASTRFTDGAQFGLGAEIGISTQKFHARGPMALKEITSYKWTIIGNGQVRP